MEESPKSEKLDEKSTAPVDTEDAIIVFPNPEKGTRVRLGPEEYMPMSSSRILLSGLPGVGKRNVILNLIHRMKPSPSCIHLVHCDPTTIEYDCLNDMNIPMIVYQPGDFPTIKNIEEPVDQSSESADEEADDPDATRSKKAPPLQNPLVIIDEITTDQLGRMGQHRFERLVNHVATHRNCTVICSIQSMLNIPPKCRRAFNHFALWKQADHAVDQMAAGRSGISYEVLRDMFGLCRDHHDFIWIDLDAGHDSPWRYRLNFLSPIIVDSVE